ncbi:hypothetical protein Moror_6717 [Moniliophthora roreri MCA 2997]|uniref:Uncharacterized protein n=2 Tax=Moniliophthora roreri TaxID=221103 RepID=V2XVY7_MONRO|nr:hypothetical protein Moror_6717 [Moniliophthora roreri MCA 2997]KAI3612731.1 hypothetical protein WG66_014726 [Moniliophthora roreri]
MSTIFRRAAQNVSRTRLFSSSAVSRKDLVQDLYLRELRTYKPAAVAKDAHVGSVKQYSAPAAPKAPSLPSDLAGELAAFDASEPTLASAPTPVATSSEDNVSGADAYLDFLEQDLPKPDPHHH